MVRDMTYVNQAVSTHTLQSMHNCSMVSFIKAVVMWQLTRIGDGRRRVCGKRDIMELHAKQIFV